MTTTTESIQVLKQIETDPNPRRRKSPPLSAADDETVEREGTRPRKDSTPLLQDADHAASSPKSEEEEEEEVAEAAASTSTSTSTSSNNNSGNLVCVEVGKGNLKDDGASTTATATEDGVMTEESRIQREKERLLKMTNACCTILECIGEDPGREGLLKTPERWAKALTFLCSGYQQTAKEVCNQAVFSENHNEMVVVRNIDIHSLCEHHMLPFTGTVHIGYIPNGKVIGLSKLARIAEVFARRLQVQERMTRQIADAVVETVRPLGVAVVVECSHFCMVMRGVQKTGSITTTSCVRGCFESNPKTRGEFFSILRNGSGFGGGGRF